MAGIAVAGSGLFHANASKSRPSVSIPAKVHKEFTPALPAFISLNQRRREVLPSKSLQTSLIRCVGTNNGYFGRGTIADAAARIAPAVAHIYARQGQETDCNIGSGTAIHEGGYILTCAHVFFDKTNVLRSADKVTVCFEDKKDINGQVVDAYVDLDIAIIKIDSSIPAFRIATVGSSSKLRRGDWAIAMGSPLSLQHSVTLGIISCVRRTSNDLGLPGMPMEYIQTDCAINPGNSGGPLCNVDGKVVGVSCETVTEKKAYGVSFAVPVDFISPIINSFQNFQSPVRPYFGWVMRTSGKNVYVHKVIKKSPADSAGIQKGDVIVKFNGKPVRDIKEMMDAMGERSGASVKVDVKRGGKDLGSGTINFKE